MYLHLKRIYSNPDETIGHLFVYNSNSACITILATLELAWRNNQRNISCIPVGRYQVQKRWSIKYGNHLEVLEVTGRSAILIHSGNYFTQTQGCILVGFYHNDINSDNALDVVQSRNALNVLLSLIGSATVYMEISNVNDIEVQ